MKQNRIKDKTKELSRRDVICRKVIEYGILGLVVLSPLPAASVSEWSILVIQLTVLVMLAAYFIMRKKALTNKLLSASMKWPRILFISLFVLIFIQIIPLPKFLIKIFSPNAYSFQKIFSPDFFNIKFMSLSLIPSHTLQQGLELLSYFLLGFIIIKTITERQQIMRIFSVLIAMGVFEAFYGMFELYNKNPRILFYKKIHYLDSITGTFVNRNHLSGYLEMIIPLAIGLSIAKINLFGLGNLKWRKKLFLISEKGFSTNLLILLSIVIMSIGIIFSNSRSGIFILFFTFLLFFELTILYFGKSEEQKKKIKNFLKISFLIIAFISIYIGIRTTVERFAIDKLLQEKRPAHWANTLEIFKDYPLFGTGLGTFSSLYPDMESGNQLIRLYHAHNDYLEYLSELGVIGMILLLGGIFYMLINSFLVWKTRKHPEVKGLALGGIISVICILLHSITDFNLHIPANMILFSVVLSLTVVVTFYKKREINRRDTKESKI